jgi:flagellar protein FliO/FliZ
MFWSFTAQSVPSESLLEPMGGFGWMLLKSTLILIGVCLLAYLLIRFVLRRFQPGASGWSARPGSRLQLVERLSLEPRRTVQVVRAGSKVLLLGVADGQISLLTELDPRDWEKQETGAGPQAHSSREVFQRVLQGGKPGLPEARPRARQDDIDLGAAAQDGPGANAGPVTVSGAPPGDEHKDVIQV